MVDGTGAGLSLLYSVRGRWAELLQQADRRFPWLVGMQHWQLGRAVSCTLYLAVCILVGPCAAVKVSGRWTEDCWRVMFEIYVLSLLHDLKLRQLEYLIVNI